MAITHKVIDLVYHEDEGNVEMVGSYAECVAFVESQTTGNTVNTYEIQILTNGEYIAYNQEN